MRYTMNLLFWMVKNRTNKEGIAPLSVRITVNGKSVEFSPQIKVQANDWIVTTKSIRGNSDVIRMQNAKINRITRDVEAIYFHLENQGKPITAEIIRDIYTGKNHTEFFLIHLVDKFLIMKKTFVGKRITQGTYKGYENQRNNLFTWLSATKKTKLLAKDFDDNRADDYYCYLIGAHRLNRKPDGKVAIGMKQNTAVGNINFVLSALNWAVKKKMLESSPIAEFSLKRDAPDEPEFLTLEELRHFKEYSFIDNNLSIVRDLFIFSSRTGMAYSDSQRFDFSVTHKDEHGRAWIVQDRSKTGQQFVLPLHPDALSVMSKYGNSLPQMCNGLYNRRLKKALQLAGINKVLTSHDARKTFAMSCAELGVPVEVTAVFMGHSDYLTTLKYYYKFGKRRLSVEFDKLIG